MHIHRDLDLTLLTNQHGFQALNFLPYLNCTSQTPWSTQRVPIPNPNTNASGPTTSKEVKLLPGLEGQILCELPAMSSPTCLFLDFAPSAAIVAGCHRCVLAGPPAYEVAVFFWGNCILWTMSSSSEASYADLNAGLGQKSHPPSHYWCRNPWETQSARLGALRHRHLSCSHWDLGPQDCSAKIVTTATLCTQHSSHLELKRQLT